MPQKNASPQALSASLIFLLSLATGLAVTTIYILQPLLQTVSESLMVSSAQVGLIVTLTQIGYAVGILFLIPLGDVLPKKKLILFKFGLLIAALIFTGLAPSYILILMGSLLIGIFATTAQDIVPLAADLADEKVRGRVVGQVMGGLLLGILLSRTMSGIISDAWGWRAVFWVESGALVLVMVALAWLVPAQPAKAHIAYKELIRSTLKSFVTYKELRKVVLTQGLIGIAFSAFWTSLSFHLGRPPLALSNSVIGLFGLAGAAGALAAPIAGRLSDTRGPRLGILVGTALVLISFVGMAFFPLSILVLFAGAVVFDLGVQMALISHQSIVYTLNPLARARLNAVFVACMFVAFSVGSLASSNLYARGGWLAVLGLCIICSCLALVVALQSSTKK